MCVVAEKPNRVVPLSQLPADPETAAAAICTIKGVGCRAQSVAVEVMLAVVVCVQAETSQMGFGGMSLPDHDQQATCSPAAYMYLEAALLSCMGGSGVEARGWGGLGRGGREGAHKQPCTRDAPMTPPRVFHTGLQLSSAGHQQPRVWHV